MTLRRLMSTTHKLGYLTIENMLEHSGGVLGALGRKVNVIRIVRWFYLL